MVEYFIIALSFAIASYFFIHKKAVKREIPIRYIMSYIIIATIVFPILVISWILDSDSFIKSYGKTLNDLMDKEKLL